MIEQEVTSTNLFLKSGRENETLPLENEISSQSEQAKFSLSNLKVKIRVFTDMEMVKEFLTDERFTLVNEIYDADIIFISKHFKNFR